MSSLGVRAFPLSYCILFCHVCLLSIGGLFFFLRGEEESKSMGEGKCVGVLGGVEGNMLEMYCLREETLFNK